MAAGPAQEPSPHCSGYPSAVVAGRTVALGIFVPAIYLKFRQGFDYEVPAKERPQFRIISPKGGGKPFPQPYTPAKTAAWEKHIGEHALMQLRSVEVDGPDDFTLPIRDCRIIMALRFNLRKPKSYPASMIHAVKKPDLDNLAKAVLDGLVLAKVIEDDNNITDLQLSKRYASDDHPLGVEIDMTCIPT